MDRSNKRLKFTTAYVSSVYVISFSFLGFECANSTACIIYKSFMTVINKTRVVLFVSYLISYAQCKNTSHFRVIEKKLIQLTIRLKAGC